MCVLLFNEIEQRKNIIHDKYNHIFMSININLCIASLIFYALRMF